MRPQRGKEKLLRAALKLFVSQGYFATTVDEVTAEAGVSKGLVYNYYSSKEVMLQALLDEATARMAKVAATLNQEGPLEGVLEAFVDQYIRFLETEREALTLQLVLLTAPELRDTVAAPQRRRAELLLNEVHGWFRRAGVRHAKRQARVLLAMLDGVALHYLLVFDRYPLRAQKPALLEAALRLCTN